MSNYYLHFDDGQGVLMLAFIGGFIDAAGYLKLQGVFTSSITGNLVVASASVSSTNGVLCRSLVSISFTLAAAVGCFVSLRLRLVSKYRIKPVSIILFIHELLLLGAVWAAGQYYFDKIDTSTSLEDAEVILVACLMGASMGFQNIAVKESFSAFPATTVMTSTLVNFGSNAATTLYYYAAKCFINSSSSTTMLDSNTDLIKTYNEKYTEFWGKLILSLKPLVVFILGAVIGAIAIDRLSFHCMFIPIFILLILLFETYFKIRDDDYNILIKNQTDTIDNTGIQTNENNNKDGNFTNNNYHNGDDCNNNDSTVTKDIEESKAL